VVVQGMLDQKAMVRNHFGESKLLGSLEVVLEFEIEE
jgi:hypothetical protein